MRTITESQSTPQADGFRMPGEFEPQKRIWMAWPRRTDTWAWGAKPAQRQYADVARAIAQFEPVMMCVNEADYKNAKAVFEDDEAIHVIEMTTDDAWLRDTCCTFVVNDEGEVRANHWHFNAYGGFHDGLYFPWDKDEQIGMKVAELAGVRRYRPDSFILEGGSFHVDGEGTVITTDMCLLSPGRNPDMSREQIEQYLRSYLNCDKVIWVKDGIDPEETNGHIDDVAQYVAPGKVLCIWTDDPAYPFYHACHEAYDTLSRATDAKGRRLEVTKVCMPQAPLFMDQASCDSIDVDENAEPRVADEPLIASYMNFLIVNGGVIVPQYGDKNDALALQQIQDAFDAAYGKGAYRAVGVMTDQIVFGGGNIHCITQQEPAGK
ncbi:agmatine deiminase [Eggerthellaceae bacterium zg-1084]|uniref:Putative agmatine deiminase n=1 Tax=Berryella wangjianweii TaxID=2734634 RepID=A0A6M8J3C9_9ACTN|nr:agmatine deiminase [Berryella wangjianweii]NPD30416.1 agmatine deiminase [Berryella wangjianweii]NPD32722.1 agmatine deiminase [Eggerthellaceae bacterium zg-997]QKF07093.1 agmatine deiminase [Berryella wangjianweii]